MFLEGGKSPASLCIRHSKHVAAETREERELRQAAVRARFTLRVSLSFGSA